jgi:hypothetical protein
MRAALRHHDLLDCTATTRTFFSFATVSTQLDFEFTGASIGAAIIAQRGSSRFDGAFENHSRSLYQFLRLLRCACTRCQRMYLHSMQRLIHIDIPETGDDLLIEEKRFDRSGATGETLCKLIRTHFERIGTHSQRLVHRSGSSDKNETKPTRVDVAEL